MYEAFYHFDVKPFANTPNVRFFYQSEQHREALAKLLYSVEQRQGISLITGQIGCGKTMLVRCLIDQLAPHTAIALINNTRVTADQMLQMICDELGLKPGPNADKAKKLTALRQFAHRQAERGQSLVLIIDEAQALPVDALEELRLLTNLENQTHKLIQLLILGQPELATTLKHPKLGPLTQRVAMYAHLQPFNELEMARYMAFRLIRAARRRPDVDFSTEALRLIYQRSKGVPRVINLLTDQALLIGFARQTHLIHSDIVQHAIDDNMPAFEPTVIQLEDVLTSRETENTAANAEAVKSDSVKGVGQTTEGDSGGTSGGVTSGGGEIVILESTRNPDAIRKHEAASCATVEQEVLRYG